MSDQGARQVIPLREGRRQRTLEERLLVRFPALGRMGGLAFMRLSPRSRLRRGMLRWRMRQVYEALGRGDMEAGLIADDRDVELHTAKDEAGVPFGADFKDVYRGHEGLTEAWKQWFAEWEEAHIENLEVIDRGEELVVLLRHRFRGKGSGVDLEKSWAQVLTLGGDGLAIRVENFWDPAKAFEAAGLSDQPLSS